jgi:hypothetical protein
MCTAHITEEVVIFKLVHFHACNHSYSDSVAVTFSIHLYEMFAQMNEESSNNSCQNTLEVVLYWCVAGLYI